jgi:hypothetical protein
MELIMNIKYCGVITILSLVVSAGLAQPPARQGPPPGDRSPIGRPGGQPGDWIKVHDSNQNEKLEPAELQEAIDRTFADFDRNKNGTIELGESKFRRPGPVAGPQRDPNGPGSRPEGPGPDDRRLLPPFFFEDIIDRQALSKSEFERAVKDIYNQMDRNRDGVLGKAEGRPPIKDGPKGNPPPLASNARFAGAEMRFGDRLVKGQPFSAETVIEDTRRLFDGSTVTTSRRGAIYRDAEGRTRRETPLDRFAAGGEKAVMLIFVNDFPGRTQFSLDLANKVARKNPIRQDGFPFPDEGGPREAKTEALGTKTIEGIRVEGTRITVQLPAGEIGNDRPIDVVTERWFSPELQAVVMSRHVDPIAGEHVFRLVNIRRAEPAGDLFAVPAGFRVEGAPGKRPEE